MSLYCFLLNINIKIRIRIQKVTINSMSEFTVTLEEDVKECVLPDNREDLQRMRKAGF